MFSFFYDLLLGFYLILKLPSLLLNPKKNRNILKKFQLPTFKIPKDKKSVWIHSVSLGETKAALPLIEELKKDRDQDKKDLFVICSCTTETGFNEAKKSQADEILFLPFDFSFLMKRLAQRIQPDLVVFIETDFWYHFLKFMKQAGSKTAVISAKLSDRSFKRFKFLSFFSNRLFTLFDLIATQNELYQERFFNLLKNELKTESIKTEIKISSNLKLFNQPKSFSSEELDVLRDKLQIKAGEKVVTIASTHAPEERLLLEELLPFLKENKQNSLKILLAPRHPERFLEVEGLLKKMGLDFSKLSNPRDTRIILIDTMGFLNQAFALSDLAVVAGSFISKIGGHNVLEPIFFKVPVMFGPHMQGQVDLKNLVLQEELGFQVELKDLKIKIENLLGNAQKQIFLQQRCEKFSLKLQNEKQFCFDLIKNLL